MVQKQPTDQEIDTILQVAGDIAYQAGKNALILILKGSRSKIIKEKGFDQIIGYGAFKKETAKEIKDKINWMIENDWLRVEYRQRQPLLFQTAKGQERIRKILSDEVFKTFDQWIHSGNVHKPETFPIQLKNINRDVKLFILQKILSRRMYEYIPILHLWKADESKRMKKKINDTIRAMIPDFFDRPYTYLRKFTLTSPQERMGRKLAFILRHHPEMFKLEMDEKGFIPIKDLAQALNVKESEIKDIVSTQDKKRFEIKRNKIRALYGHSLPVKIDLKKTKPPKELYHNAPRWVRDKILIEGLRPMKRGFIHLAVNIDDAKTMSSRGPAGSVIFKVDAQEAHKKGVVFYKVDETYLVENIPPQFLQLLPEEVAGEGERK